MSLPRAVTPCLGKHATFSGWAGRAEHQWFSVSPVVSVRVGAG